jgi:hypothetical protein
MRLFRIALLLLVCLPGTAWAGEVTVRTVEVPLAGARTLAAAQPREFDLAGVQWQGAGTVSFRTRSVAGRWSAWRAGAPEAEDLPDRGTAERLPRRGWTIGQPYWTGPSNAIEYRTRGVVRRLRASFVWSAVEAVPPRRTTYGTSSPLIVPRLSWGADESIVRATPRYAPELRFAIVHHTAGSNSYTAAQSAAIVKGIQAYHVKSNGWNDVGYNFFVDKYGQVFEGRGGGVERNVVGAHAEGFNTGSFGVAVLGNYGLTSITPAARDALVKLLAWRFDVAHVDPVGTLTWTSAGNARYPSGIPVFLRTVSGHRDTGFTNCPGDKLYAELATIGAGAGRTGLPKLYTPVVRGALGGTVRFTAKASGAEPWTVTVKDALGKTVGAGSGIGPAIDWTWDATLVPGGRYTWTIDLSGARPAKGTLNGPGAGGTPPPSVLTPLLGPVVIEPGTVTPNADGLNDTANVSYTLGSDALVTATLVDPAGVVRATFLNERKPAGKRAFTVTADAVADGQYRIVLNAVADDGTQVSTEAPLVVSRLLRSFVVEPELFSPNADGRGDTVSFAFELSGPATVALKVYKGTAWITTPFQGELAPGVQAIPWDGAKRNGRLLDGEYRVELSVADAISSVSQALTLRADSTAPKVTLASLAPLKLKLSEPADVTIVVNGKLIVTSELGEIFSVDFAGKARKVRAVAVDEAGNVSKPLLVGYGS